MMSSSSHLLLLLLFTFAFLTETLATSNHAKRPHRPASSSSSNDVAVDDNSKVYSANEEQIEQFTRLLYERLNLREPPNVTTDISEGTGFPSSIVKQLEQQTSEQQQRLHHQEELQSQRQLDDSQPTAERAILPGNAIPNYSCRRQLAAKMMIHDKQLQHIECFQFVKPSMETKSLPFNQAIKQMKIFVKKSFLKLSEPSDIISPGMFQVFQVFRPASNDTSPSNIASMTDTHRLPISHAKSFNGQWLELTISSTTGAVNLQQIYRQFLMPWHGLAINRVLQIPSISDAWSYNREFFRLNDDEVYTQNDDDDDSSPSNLYMLVEYGNKTVSPARRGIRAAPARPARVCEEKSPCCRRSLMIDFDQSPNALNFVIYPRKIDLGQCIGMCGLSGSSLKHTEIKNAQHKNEHHAGYNLFLLHHANFHRANRTSTTHATNHVNGQGESSSNQCCSYSRTGGLEVLYRTTNDGPIIRKYIPNMIVEECRCGLPATIQQV